MYYTQSWSLSHWEMVPDIFVCWPGGGPPPPFQLHPGAPRGQRFENTVNTSVFSSSSPQQWPKIMEFTAFFVAVRQKTPQKPMVFDASRLEKWPKKYQKPGKILSEGCFWGFWRLQNCTKLWYLQGFVHLPGRKRRYLHGFLRFSSTQPWCASGSTATKHRKYQCFQLLLSSRREYYLASGCAITAKPCAMPFQLVLRHVDLSGHAIKQLQAVY